MATPYSNRSTEKPYNVLLAGFFLLLTINVNPAQATFFNFTEFIDDGSLILQGDAKIWASGTLALTADPLATYATSRALYATRVPLWDSTTGNIASFVTSFSFTVGGGSGDEPADGLVFFLAPWGTGIPNNSTGGNLGILDGSNGFNQFVAVEFDSYINSWDPNYRHIGIDINSLISVNTVPWIISPFMLEKATIRYDSLTQTLTVSVAHPNGQISTVSQVINLKAVLPENVSVGFSATTSPSGWEIHNIHSWSFTSNLNTNGAMENINIASYA